MQEYFCLLSPCFYLLTFPKQSSQNSNPNSNLRNINRKRHFHIRIFDISVVNISWSVLHHEFWGANHVSRFIQHPVRVFPLHHDVIIINFPEKWWTHPALSPVCNYKVCFLSLLFLKNPLLICTHFPKLDVSGGVKIRSLKKSSGQTIKLLELRGKEMGLERDG